MMGSEHYRHYWPRFFDCDDGKTGEEAMKLVLSNLHELNEPLHWSIAYRLAMADQNSRKSVVVTRAQQEFWSLFQSRYENEFPGGLVLNAAKQSAAFRYQPAIAHRFRKATNLIFFNSRGLAEEIADLLNERSRQESWPVNPFRVHHGSLSKDLREATEAELKADQPITALCTRTLERNCDSQDIDCVR